MNTQKQREKLQRQADQILKRHTQSKAPGKARRLSPAWFTNQSTTESRRQKREFSKHLQIQHTPSEAKLKKLLETVHGNWKSQKLIFGWIADFWSYRLQMIIEVDGGYHSTPEQAEKDVYRDRVMGSYGIRTLRIKNEEIETNPDDVMSRLKKIISARELEIGRRTRGFANQLVRGQGQS